MANPQKEDGSFPIANEIAEAFMRVNLCPYENRVLWVVLRQTYGWQKKEDFISFSQISKKTGLDRRHAARGMKRLLEKNIVIKIDDSFVNKYRFNKNFETWKSVTRRGTSADKGDTLSSKKATKMSSKPAPTNNNKNTYTKNNKESLCLKKNSDEDKRLTQLLVDLMIQNDSNSSIIRRLTEKRQIEWMDACRKLREIDKRSPELIEKIIRFSQEDDFWKGNILSIPKLREKFDQLFHKAKKQRYSGIKEWLEERNGKPK